MCVFKYIGLVSSVDWIWLRQPETIAERAKWCFGKCCRWWNVQILAVSCPKTEEDCRAKVSRRLKTHLGVKRGDLSGLLSQGQRVTDGYTATPTAGLSVTAGTRSTAECSVVVHEETVGVQPDDRVADGWKEGRRVVELGVLAEALDSCGQCSLPMAMRLSSCVGETRQGLGGWIHVTCTNPACRLYACQQGTTRQETWLQWITLKTLFHLDYSSKEIMNTLLKSTTEPKLTFWGRGYIKRS